MDDRRKVVTYTVIHSMSCSYASGTELGEENAIKTLLSMLGMSKEKLDPTSLKWSDVSSPGAV